jgi:hypothetical protein
MTDYSVEAGRPNTACSRRYLRFGNAADARRWTASIRADYLEEMKQLKNPGSRG